MSDQVNKPDIGLKTQEEIELKVSEISQSGDDPALPDSAEKTDKSRTTDPGAEKEDGSESIKTSHASEQTSESAFGKADPPSPPLIQFHRPASSGLKRHNAIVATCAILSCSFLGLSAVDLKHLIGKQAIMSESTKITYMKVRPELPPTFTYTSSRYSDWEIQDDFINEAEEVSANKLLQVAKHTWDGRKIGFVNRTGKIVIPPNFVNAGYFYEGLANAQSGTKEKLRWGFIDESGNFKIPPKFDSARNFHNGAAVVEIEGLCGLIDKSGSYVVKPSLRAISELGANFLAHTLRGKVGILSPSGQWLLPPAHGRIYSFKENNREGVNFPYGLLRNSYSYETNCKDKIFKIQTQNQVGIIDENGKFLLPAIYDDVLSFSGGVAAVKVNGKIGFAKADGKYVIQPQYDQTTPFADVIAVRNHSKPWSFIDRNGNAIKAPPVDDIITDSLGNWFMDGLGPFIEKGKVGYMNTNGDAVVRPQFDFGMPFVAGHAEVWTGNCWKIIDTRGDFVPGLVLQDLSVFSNGNALVTIPGFFYPLVEFSKINSNRETIKNWKENARARQPVVSETWGEY